MADLTTEALRLVRIYGPLAVAVFTFLESSMLFPFLPSEVVVPGAAVVLVHDVPSFAAFVGAAGVGGTVGAFVPFYAFRGPGSRWARRLENYVHVSEAAVERARRWFLDWGASSVLWGRFLPGLRSVVSVPAGLVGMDPRWFGAFTAVGTLAFYAAVAAVVHVARRRDAFAAAWTLTTDRPGLAALALFGGVAAILLATVWYRKHKR